MITQWLLSTPPLLGPWTHLFVLPLVAWELVWKGLALWRSARHGETTWFIAILVLNTLGILPIVYLILKPEPMKGKTGSRKK